VRSMNCSGADGVPARTPCWVATLLPDDYVPVFGGHAPTHRLVACGEDNGPRCLPVQRGVLVGERGRRRRCCRERSHNVLYPIVAIKNPLPRHQDVTSVPHRDPSKRVTDQSRVLQRGGGDADGRTAHTEHDRQKLVEVALTHSGSRLDTTARWRRTPRMRYGGRTVRARLDAFPGARAFPARRKPLSWPGRVPSSQTCQMSPVLFLAASR
jgi:hypothetical protein